MVLGLSVSRQHVWGLKGVPAVPGCLARGTEGWTERHLEGFLLGQLSRESPTVAQRTEAGPPDRLGCGDRLSPPDVQGSGERCW